MVYTPQFIIGFVNVIIKILKTHTRVLRSCHRLRLNVYILSSKGTGFTTYLEFSLRLSSVIYVDERSSGVSWLTQGK